MNDSKVKPYLMKSGAVYYAIPPGHTRFWMYGHECVRRRALSSYAVGDTFALSGSYVVKVVYVEDDRVWLEAVR